MNHAPLAGTRRNAPLRCFQLPCFARTANHEAVPAVGPVATALDDVTPGHLLVSEGQQWRLMHALATPAFAELLERGAFAAALRGVMEEWHRRAVALLPLWRLQAAGVALTLVGMGHENVSATAAWALLLLAAHPEQQQALYRELRHSRTAALLRLPYLDAVLRETLRLYPPVPMLSRQLMQDTTIGGVMLPKDVELVVSPYVLHRLPRLWGPHAACFQPERFMPPPPRPPPAAGGGCTEPAAAGPYLPFGAGPRACPGASFGSAEVKLLVAHVVMRYSLELLQPPPPSPRQLFVSLRPGPGVRVCFVPRHQQQVE
eukprot:XP_001692168.1 cytochrome P450 [Chlamydomonas reinhardtii]